MQKTKILALLLLLLLVGAWIFLQKRAVPQEPSSLEGEKEKILGLFNSADSKEAIDYFRGRYETYDRESQERLAKFVGERLFKKSGLDAISFCSRPFSYFCFQGFWSAALASGDRWLPQADSLCRRGEKASETFGECVHIIGQLLIRYRENDKEMLLEALEGCDALGTQEGQKGCQNGVWTQYNTRSLSGGEEEVRGEFDENQPYLPCSQVPQRYQGTCYFELPFRWKTAQVSYERMWQFCGEIGPWQETCSRGIGHMLAVVTNFNKEEISANCMAKGRGFRQFCITEALKYMIFEQKEDAFNLCDALAGREECRKIGEEHQCQVFGKCE